MNRTVLVTGASGDLGYATVIEFAKKGYNVVIHYFKNFSRANSLEKEVIEKYSVQTLVVCSNLSNEEEVSSMFLEISKKFGCLDVLVNNAAISNDSILMDKTKDDFIKVYETNLVGPFLCSKYASKLMNEKKKGVIINISSTNAVKTNYPYSADYDASKAALNSLSRNLAVLFAPYIRVVVVSPGWIDTLVSKSLDDDYKKDEENKILLKRFADVSEIAHVIAFLASDDASYINNTVIDVHGGFYE